MGLLSSRTTVAALVALTAAVASPAAAPADSIIAGTTTPTYISNYGGVTAWSELTDRGYRLALRIKGKKTLPKAVDFRKTPFDVSLGPDPDGKTVALYTRCKSDDETSGCDVYRYDLGLKKEQLLESVSLQGADEMWPAQWKNNYAFVRRRYNGNGTSEQDRCDAPFKRSVVQKRRIKSIELPRGACGIITGLAFRSKTVVTSMTSFVEGATRSELRTTSIDGGKSRVLMGKTFSGPSDIFGSPVLDADYVYATRTGVGPAPAFVRIRQNGSSGTQVEAQTILTGSVAWEKGKPTYVEAQGAPQGADCAPITPCRIMVADSSPFSSATRTLAPRLTLSPPAATGLFGNQPLQVTGSLTQPLVKSGRIVGSKPVAGVPIEILRADYAPTPSGQTLVPTLAPRLTTGADGSWALTVPPPVPVFGYYTAITRGSEIAPAQAPIVTLKTSAAVTLDATPKTFVSGALVTFSGTVAPVQSGRSVSILQPLSPSFTENIGQAPVQADGSFSVTLPVTASGGYVADLPADPFDGAEGNRTYTGRSAPVQLTVGG